METLAEPSSGRGGSRHLAPRQALEPAQSSCSQGELRPALRPLLTAQHRTYYFLEAAQSCDLHDDDGLFLSSSPLCETSDYPKLAEQVLQKMCLYTRTYAQYTRHTQVGHADQHKVAPASSYTRFSYTPPAPAVWLIKMDIYW